MREAGVERVAEADVFNQRREAGDVGCKAAGGGGGGRQFEGQSELAAHSDQALAAACGTDTPVPYFCPICVSGCQRHGLALKPTHAMQYPTWLAVVAHQDELAVVATVAEGAAAARGSGSMRVLGRANRCTMLRAGRRVPWHIPWRVFLSISAACGSCPARQLSAVHAYPYA